MGLGVGLRDPAEIAALLRVLGKHHAAGLVLRAPVAVGDEIAAAAAESGVAVIASEFLDRVGGRARAVVGIGSVAQDAAGMASARASTDRALRVLRTSANGTRAGGRAGRCACGVAPA
jgi:hypothetical protein